MANHLSAKKRSRQYLSRNHANTQYLTKIRTKISNLNKASKSKNTDQLSKLFSEVNSSMAKAVKRGIIKKQTVARKLSSLSNLIKKK